MNIHIQNTEVGRFAHIETASDVLDVLLDDSMPTTASLRQLAHTLQGNAATMAHSLLLRMAADHYERVHCAC